jgi:superfamily II DNA or RNA helicase
VQKTSKLNLLDHFYEYLEEHDWLSGVDLYQGGRVNDLKTFDGLIIAKVRDDLSAEVRLKIHPGGRCIQWIECTCRKNRALGHYCAHIAALVMHIDRERPELFGALDTAMPLKPPAMPKRPKLPPQQQSEPLDPNGSKGRSTGATETIIGHLKGGIQGVSLIAHGPMMRIRMEIKAGHMTHYDLTLDAAAKFLLEHPDLPNATQEVRDIRVHTETIELGTKIYQPEPERIIAERVIAWRSPGKGRKNKKPEISIPHENGGYWRITPSYPDGEKDDYIFIALKAASKYLGQEYAFIPGHGYYPLSRSSVTNAWAELPLSRSFKEDEAAEFAIGRFADYLTAGPVFADEHLRTPMSLEAPELAEITILEQGNGWFKLDPRYGKGKSSVSMVELMRQWRKKRRQYVRTGDRWVKIPEFVTQHDWQFDEDGDSLKVDALGLMRLKAAVGDFDRFVGSKRLLNQIRNRLEFVPESESTVPYDDRIQLRHYQDVGLRWLWWLYSNGLHGLLADEMGLGKTHQAMALMTAINQTKSDARFLVICPTTVLDHWIDKVEQYAPSLKPIKFHGSRRGSFAIANDRNHRALITSYGVMLRDIKQLAQTEWDAIILDEAHFVKNNDTATYQAACLLKGRIRICLTGTPMENHLGELKSLFDFLIPGYLGSDEYFRRTFLTPIQRGDDPEVALALQKLIYPFKLRRTKVEVLPDLPAKVEDLRHCSLADEQVRLYREIVNLKAKPLIEQLQNDTAPVPYLHVFATLTLLKQICNHPALIAKSEDYKKHESGKFELLKELLEEALGSGHKIVIFSQYVGMIEIIEKYLKSVNVTSVCLTGQTRNRGEVIKKFQTDPETKVFLGSLLAGGIGIDLTAASVVIHYDRWWNATKENQATDRVHRIGQNRNVQVLKLITRGTLEEKIDRMIQSKAALFERFLDKDEEIFKTLSRQELIELLT